MRAMTVIEPFTLDIPESDLNDLRRRLVATRWPEKETVDDWSQGIPLAYVRELCEYWADGYDWRRCETRLNELGQFRTEIDGLAIHFLHVRSPHDDAVPLVLTHGWPGSVVEFLEVIEPLTNPTEHGGAAEDAFHVVCPSLPGYGFSDKPTATGWNPDRIARAWDELMRRLGYDAYFGQGGDWGSMVTTSLGSSDLEGVRGIHLNMPIALPDPDTMDSLTPQEQAALDSMTNYQRWEAGYSTQQASRPQTVGYGLADSPVGQMAWIVEKFWAWTHNEGHPEDAIGRDHLLDNVMLYWLPNSGASSARLYWEAFHEFNFRQVTVPVGISIFPKEIFRTSKRWAEKRFDDLRYFDEPTQGGHFAAFEQPEEFVRQVRAAIATMR
jgi:pimeloyl-ACP methyl ester carboxylesterase